MSSNFSWKYKFKRFKIGYINSIFLQYLKNKKKNWQESNARPWGPETPALPLRHKSKRRQNFWCFSYTLHFLKNISKQYCASQGGWGQKWLMPKCLYWPKLSSHIWLDPFCDFGWKKFPRKQHKFWNFDNYMALPGRLKVIAQSW